MNAVDSSLKCIVCGESEFEGREGFYYCLECGTKQEQVRQVIVDTGDVFNDIAGTKQSTKITKLNVVKAEKPKLTSWECYNYILRGYVEELLAFGAKEELKLMALQVWAAYLRHMEVAFFSKKQADLPRLGPRYFKSDAETIYNHSIARKKKRKRTDDKSCTSGETRGTSYRTNMRKLDESLYSSATSATSTSANSNKAIKICYNMRARKILKKIIPSKHLLRHQMDAEGLLECHKQPTCKELGFQVHQIMTMSLKQVHAILAIALNLIQDDIQLSDLIRFINEGHIGRKNVLNYFPENVASNAKEILKNIDFYRFREKHTDKYLRYYIGIFSKNSGIQKFQNPNIIALVKRYVAELCLPQEIGIYVERLINFLPPRFDTRVLGQYPGYEARAMAYIIFVLKLLFGLDGHKEKRMSRAAQKINRKIKHLNRKNGENHSLLYVWDEWVQYIEMRKVIVSYYNADFCKQFNQCKSTTQILEQMAEEIRYREEQEELLCDSLHNNVATKEKWDVFKALFETFLEDCKQKNQIKPAHLLMDFKPTYTPALTYFKNILLYHENINSNATSIKIPSFMRTNHTERDMQSYLEVKPLIEYFQNNNIELRVNRLDTTESRHYNGIFRSDLHIVRYPFGCKPCFDISEEDWLKKIPPITYHDVLDWKKDLTTYSKTTIEKKMREIRRVNLRNSIINEEADKHNTDAAITIHEYGNDNAETRTTYTRNNVDNYPGESIGLFSENNMDPLNTGTEPLKPRRDLGKSNIFLGIEDEDDLIQCNDTAENGSMEDGYHSSRSESPSQESMFSNADIEIKREFNTDSTSEEHQPLNFYISNMDCWMLLGYIRTLSKLQLRQLQAKFPTSFSWLLETCAQTLGVEWSAVYEQLMVIELMLCIGIDDIEKYEDCVYLNYHNVIKDFQTLVNFIRRNW